jgi:hypothetical protein
VLKVLLEDVAKMFVQRHRPAETLADVILRGKAAAHGLSFPSGHAMVIFAITVLVSPFFKGWWKVLPWALAAAVCLSRVYLGAHFPLDVAAGAGLGTFIGGVLSLEFGVPGNSPSPREQITVSPRPQFVETVSMVPWLWHLAATTFLKTAIPLRPEACSRLLCRAGEAWPGALPLRRLAGTAIRSGRPRQHRRIRPGRPRTVLRCAG